MRRLCLILIMMGCAVCMSAQQKLFVMSYNVENLFDTKHDTLKNDYDYLPAGSRHWTFSRYKLKLHHIAQVIVNIGQATAADNHLPFTYPDLVGLCEVENEQCLSDLVKYHLGNQNYSYLHEESPDPRGIDVALLYRSPLTLLHHEVLRQYADTSFLTRDVLYASFARNAKPTNTADTSTIYHVFVCHLPSMLAGQVETSRRQGIMLSLIQHKVDSLLAADNMADIIVMGDMNGDPHDNISGLHNLMLGMPANMGTHKYDGQWEYLDQIYVSSHLFSNTKSTCKAAVYTPEFLTERDSQYLDIRPWRTYNGMRYCKGYSDHFPVYTIIEN